MKKLLEYFLLFIGIFFIIYYGINKDFVKVLTSISLILLVFIPSIIKIEEKLTIVYYIYLFILLVLGCLFNLYNITTYYDNLAHFLFGFASSISTCYILKKFDVKNKLFTIICIILFTLGVSALWELFEYINSIIFSLDIQHVLDTGINDTMSDIIMSLIASILFSIYFAFNKKSS